MHACGQMPCTEALGVGWAISPAVDWAMHRNSGMQAAGAVTSGGKLKHGCVIGLLPASFKKSAAADKFGVAADVALQQAGIRCPASIGKQASSRSKSAPQQRAAFCRQEV